MKPIDEAKVRDLIGQGWSQRKIAKELGIPRTTLQGFIRRQAGKPKRKGTPKVHLGVPQEDLTTLGEVLAWWRERKALIAQAKEGRETQRQTYHVETHFIERIKQYAQEADLTITQVVNLAFRNFFGSQK